MRIRTTLIAALVVCPPTVAAQAPVPFGDLTIMAPAAPGGGWDQTARAMQHVLRNQGLVRSVQVVNAAGAAGTIGLARFVNAERGNPGALLVTGLVMVSGVAANNSPVTLADVTPIARLSGEYEVIVVPATSPHRTLDDLVAAFRENPRAISWGGGSAGGTDEILVRLLSDRIGVARRDVNYIAYSGGGQALASVLGGHVSAAVSGLGEFGAQIESGQLRALAISAPARLSGVDIPTFHDHGIDLTLLNWRGVVAPPGITRQERRALERLVADLVGTSDWREMMRRSGWADIHLAGDDFERFIDAETARIAPIAAAPTGDAPTDYFGLIVLIGLGVTIAALLIDVRRRSREDAPAASRPNAVALTTLALALIVDILLFQVVGFVIASAVMFVLVARAFGSRRILRDALVGVALAAAVFLTFTRALGVVLPAGILG